MRILKKTIALFCSISLLLAGISAFAAEDSAAPTDIDYSIANTYKNVDWEACGQYKADLHSHTNASDGSDTLLEMTEAHYSHGFDIVAVTDHGIVDYGWTEQRVIPAMSVAVTTFKEGRGGIVAPLDKNGGTAANESTYKYEQTAAGDYYFQTDSQGVEGRKMLRVPYGIENNPTSLNNVHVNSWFVDYGHAKLGGTSDYITPISGVEALGGLSVINHPGEYTNARDELYRADAYDENNLLYGYKIDKFAGILTDYRSCLGIDVNSKGDSRTRFDRKLWDILLQRVVPTGRNVFGFATSDAHSVDAVYSGYTVMCLEANTVENLRKCLSEGSFFAASKNLGSYEEIKEIADLLCESTSAAQLEMGVELTQLYKKIEAELADGDQGSKYNAPFEVEAPRVTGVGVDEAEDTITLSTSEDALLIRWIADGKLIATGNTIDLDDFGDKIGSYVRAEIFGKGGIVYTQPFTLEYDGAPEAQDNDYIDLWFLASVIPDNLVRLLAAIPIFDVIWAAMSR